ncbi:MAG: 2-amino-4-hydroxy-6-hydroxymethyldihydropteridine diphosphokinase [Planctomycetota bacterium]|jgi:2-amino-4-hydroxy-6-hydroxymethyldihydropteridine diphosphokinase
MVQAAVAIGGNVGDVPAAIEAAFAELARHKAAAGLRCSGLFRSAPMGEAAGEKFWNAACVFETTLEPHALLDELQRVEDSAGRTREVRWGPRTLDLDLILYGDQVVASDTLTVPHPHFWYRGFVLEPLAELIPDVRPPGFGLTVRELAERLRMRPFRLGIGGEFDEAVAGEVAEEFSDAEGVSIELVTFSSASALGLEGISVALWFGDVDVINAKAKIPLLIGRRFEPQVLRDVLAAAVGALERV